MKNFKGIFFALISSGTFGLIPLFAIPLIQTQQIQIPSILFYRFLFSTLFMGVACLLQRKSFKIQLKNIFMIFIFSLLYSFTALGLTTSYLYIPSGVATTIHFLYPIFVSFLMVLFFKEKRSMALFFAAFISLLGVSLLCWNGAISLNIIGILIALSTVVTYGLYIVSINQSSTGRLDAEVLTFYILFFCAILFFFFALFQTGIESIPISTSAWSNLILLALLPTVISDLTLILAIKYAGSTITAILGSMEPLVAVLIGVFYFSEPFNIYTFYGIILIIVSVLLIIIFSKKSKSVDS